jgi:membrane protease YdiL (CAAX protease family)
MSEETHPGVEINVKEFEVDENRGMKGLSNVLNSIYDQISGLGTIFDFSKKHSSGTKFLNVMGVTGFDILWLIGILYFLISVVGLGSIGHNLSAYLNPIGLSFFQTLLPAEISQSEIFEFFFACVMAPLWETFVFIIFPLWCARIITRGADPRTQKMTIWVFAVFASIIFGLAHNGVISILIQGVGGMMYCWLFLRNNRSYWSPVFAHSIWNFMVIFGLPGIVSAIAVNL